VGNRLSLETDLSAQGGSNSSESYNYASDSHRLSEITGERSFEYDAAGNTLANGPASFSYNDRNRMATSTANGLTTAYQHNALGQRVIKTNSTTNTHYLYDIGGRLIGEADASSGEIEVEYSYLDGEPLTMWREAAEPPAVDTDGDGIADDADTDDDNDGVDDSSDVFPLDATEDTDTDSDGIGNNADSDDDNDGVNDGSDAFPLDATEDADTDSDGLGNNADPDDDNDGVDDANDAFPLDPTEDADTDGVDNNADPDDDNNGINETNDTFPLDATEDTDSDGGSAGDDTTTDEDSSAAGANDATVNAVSDWGNGFNVTFVHEITAADTINGELSAWRIELNYSGDAEITNAWMVDYGGGIISGEDNGQYRLTNEGVGYKPTLSIGETLTFNVQGQGSGYIENDFGITFISLDELPASVEPVTTLGTAVNVNDWYNPAWGGGFNATFECELQGESISAVEIAFNYSGSGTPTNSWTQNYIGSIESGFIAEDGGYAIRTTGNVPNLSAGDVVSFTINVQDSGYSETDFAVQCTTGGQ